MSDNGEIFRYKKHGGKFLKMRKEFLEICEYDVINALILRVFENELEQKRAAYEATNAQRQVRGQQPQRPNFWIEMPWARLIHKLHMDGNMSENTIKAHMRSVLAKTFLIQRKNPKDPNRKPYQYMLNVDAIQNAIDHLGDEPFLDDASYLAPPEEVESQVSTSDPSTIDTSNFDPSTPSQELIPSHQDLTPRSRSAGYQTLTPLIDNIDSQNKEIIIDEYIATESDTPTISPPSVGALTLSPQSAMQSQQGDAHVDILPGSADGSDTLPSADMGDLPASGQDRRLAAPARRPVVPTGQEKIGDNHAVVATHTPGGGDTARSVDHRPEQAVREAVHGEAVSKKGRDDGQLEQNTSTPMPAQTTPPTSEQAASGQELVTHCYLCGETASRVPVPGPLVCESCKRKAKQAPKWNVAAMVAEAERLREKPFSAIARPKETKKAQALFKRKPDLTQEEFEAAWRHWATPWWHENNGLFTLTDLAATPKNKSEMRLIIALEKLERGKPPLFTVPKQSTFVPRPSKIEVPDDFILSAYSYH